MIFRYIIVDMPEFKEITLSYRKIRFLYIFHSSQKRDLRKVTDGKKFHYTENIQNRRLS